MLRSMTAYGRGSIDTSSARITVELQTVNRKFLEVNLNLPGELRRFDIDIRKWVSEKIWCGQLNITIGARFHKHPPFTVTPNLGMAKQIYHAWKAIGDAIGVDLHQHFDWKLLTKEPGLLIYETDNGLEEEFRGELKTAFDEAIAYLIEMKEKEAMLLRIDIEERLAQIQAMLEEIEKLVADSPVRWKEKLAARLQEALPNVLDHEDRLLRELIVYAERVDVTEEITRLRAHLKQFEALLEGRVGGVGKTMDFLLQEMNREAHTLSAKSTELQVARLIVEVKSNLAKIREQIQNVE